MNSKEYSAWVSKTILDEIRPMNTLRSFREYFGLPPHEPLFEAAQKVVDSDGETGR